MVTSTFFTRVIVPVFLAFAAGCGSSATPGAPDTVGIATAACNAWKPSDASWSTVATSFPGSMSVPQASSDGKYIYSVGTWIESGSAKSRIFRSQDLGDSWCEIPTESSIVGVLASGSAELYATTDDGKLLRTSDGGGTWATSQVPTGANVGPAGEGVFVSDAPGVILAAAPDLGLLYVSSDGGANWTSRPFPEGLARGTDPMAIVISQLDAVDRPTGRRVLVSGLVGHIPELLSQPPRRFASDDGGATWHERMLPVPSTFELSPSIVTDGGGALYVADEKGMMYRSSDWADTWTMAGELPATDVTVSSLGSHRAGELFAAGQSAYWRTVDGGASWQMVDGPAASTIEVAVGDGESLIGRAAGGPISSQDGGQSWQDRSDVPLIGFMTESPVAPYPLWAASRDFRDKSERGVRSIDGGASWTPTGISGGVFLFDGADADVAYGFPTGQRIERTEDGGRTWAQIDTADVFEIETGTVCAPPTSCLYAVFLRLQPFATTLARTDDRGRTWTESGPTPDRVGFGGVVAVAPDDPMRLFITCMAGVCETRDGGVSWTPHELSGAFRLASFAFAPNGVLLLAREQGSDRQIQRSDDDGATWTVVHSLTTEGPGTRLVGSRTSPSTLFLLTGRESSRSDDAGARWQPASPTAYPSLVSVVDAPNGGFLGSVDRYGLVHFD